MARNQPVAPTPQRKTQRKGSFLPFISGLSTGLFVAFVIYLKGVSPSLPETDVSNTSEIPIKEVYQPAEVVEVEKPKFDFYTILPEREVKVPQWEPPKAKTPSGEEMNTGAYIFQVGSFQKRSDADGVRARLTMLGFPVEIQRVVINGQKIWFRVRVGPYKDSSKLNSISKRLSANNMDYILLRIKNDT